MPETFVVRDWDVTNKLILGATKTITEHMKGMGRFGVTFSYSKGAHRLDIRWAALLEDSREISRDAHHGTTGARHDKNTYVLEIKEFHPGARYVLQASVRSDGGTDSSGEVWLRTLPPGRAR